MSYFGNIKRGIKTTAKGMSLTLQHFADARFSRAEKQIEESDFFELDKGHVTIQYPHETITIPDHGRNQLDCEIDDCIVCDKCAKICPVDCIEIEAIRSPELIRQTSDGSPVRLHAAKFDIDMAKCCFCGLCTTVCPTECLTMGAEYDYSVLDVTQLNFAFANLSEEDANEKRELYDQFVKEKEIIKAEKLAEAKKNEETKPAGFKPGMKPAAKPAFRPIIKPKSGEEVKRPVFKPRPIFKPSLKKVEKSEEKKNAENAVFTPKKPAFKPSLKPSGAKPKPSFTPSTKPAVSKAKPAFKPTIKPKTEGNEEKPEVKPAFRPSIKPKKD